MPVLVREGRREWRHRTTARQWVSFAAALAVTAAVAAAAATISEQTTWVFVLDAGLQMRDLGLRMFPPDASYALTLGRPLLETVHIATLGTVLGVVVALPLAYLAARTTTPSRIWVRPLALLALVTSRSVNSIIWALVLVVLLGPGLPAGVIAIALRSVGFVGRLVYEAIEEAPTLPVVAMEATGASRSQALTFGLLPHILPTVAGVSIYRWEINIREATILGLVGAGGIGMALQASIDALAWSGVSVILLAILVTVLLAEVVSSRVRRGLA
ncbi:MAG: phosphonate ABC transporter, permease protein PhnE [Gemmatimonadales bacterium]